MKLLKEDIWTCNWIFATGIIATSVKHKVRINIWDRGRGTLPDDMRVDIKGRLNEISY